MQPVLPEGTPERIGPYRILEQLGTGGMGTVFLARNAAGEQRAVKLLLHVNPADAASVKRLYREARSAQGVHHPHLCSVHDVGQDGDLFYLAMERIEGRTLATALAAGEAFSTARAVKLVCTLAEAVHALHEAGIVHRDLKPANVMLRPDGAPVVIDFGMARRFDNSETLLTLTGSIAGTPGYMAPEQITGEADEIGPPCDLYSLGVILYELVTGSPPFSGNVATILGSIVSEPAPPPRTRCPQLDPVLDEVCLRALAKRPAERFASARELADVLAAWLRDPGLSARMLGEIADRTPPRPSADSPPSESGGIRRIWNSLLGRE
ncbi:MAG: serine/threonine protein kinase [Planctomycetaceae bacterium]|nr:serine/threonine protein kinase [Planctomycetaceae bacterium]